jgi:endonuclease/exonuclease/phosphatase family metal-dependent hydrolase
MVPEEREGDSRITAATWNIHRWIGRDGRSNPRRTVDAIRSLRASIIALQEVSAPWHGVGAVELLERELGMTAVPGPTMQREDGDYGNVLLTRFPVIEYRGLALRVPPFEPRGAIDARVRVNGREGRILATHLGLRRKERAIQAGLLATAKADDERPVWLVLADMNEWLPWSLPERIMRRHFGSGARRRTFPSNWPVLPLDRILVHPDCGRLSTEAVRERKTAMASDHLPLRAVVGGPPRVG